MIAGVRHALQRGFSCLMHDSAMSRIAQPASLPILLCLAWLAVATLPTLQAQENTGATAGSSTEVEESDEAYRRRMELEDARQRNLGYTLPPESYAAKQEKLDKLPEESRDNIRDQLVDIIVENGDWQPSDALKEYPYVPTEAARGDPELMQREQEAWDEQIEKYHKREAAAFGTYLGPVPGPGNPDGPEGDGESGSDGSSGQQAGGQGSEQGEQAGAKDASQDGKEDSAGTYEPYQSSHGRSEEAVSTAGVQQSALDFIKGLQGQAQPPASQAAPQDASAQNASPQDTAAQSESQAEEASSQQNPESMDDATPAESADQKVEIDLTTPGLITIEDLKKLEGTEDSDTPDEPDRP
jgi:hypothetical protein